MKDKNKTKEQFIEEFKKLRRQISELRKKEIEYQTADEREKRYVRDLKSLSKMAVGLVDLSFEEDIYQFIAEQLKELVGNCMVVMNSFDEESETFCVRSVLGIGKHMDNVLKILGRHPVGMSAPINDEAREGLTSGKLEKVPGGLYELSIGSISKPACSAIEKLLGLGDAYAMGFSWRGKLFGSAVVFMHKGAEIGDPSIIETFIRQASVALQRRQAQEALRIANEDLERRVKARTAELENTNKKLQLEITERRRTKKALQESEQKYRTLIERANDGIAIIQDNLLKYVNPRLAKIGGYSVAELTNTPFTDYAFPEELPKLINRYKRRMAGEDVIQIYESTLKHKNGQKILFEVNASVIKYQEKPAVLAIVRDITDRKKAMDELRKAYADLEKTQQELIQSEKLAALGRFSSGVAHEIKNPLGIIMGGLEFLEIKLSRTDADIKTAIDKIKKSTFRANTIVQGLLKLARPSELKTERIKPNDLINETLSLLKYRAPLSNLKIETHYTKEKLYIEADRNQMHQVLFNLLMNAIEAMPKGGIITVKTYKMALSEFSFDKRLCVIEVIDRGEGISKENLERLFEPFFTTKREKKGTGLGLSIAKLIVNNHKGNLEIESKLRKGTTAKIILPLA